MVQRDHRVDAGTEQLVDSVVSPKGKYAALSTKKRVEIADARGVAPGSRSSDWAGGRSGATGMTVTGTTRLEWRLRVVSLASGKVVRDEPDAPGLGIRAISDAGLLVQSGARGIVVTDVPGKKQHELDARAIDLGYRGFFRNDKELVYVAGTTVGVLDVTND